jgi:hypothetical protein
MGAKTVLTERCDATIRGIEETRRRISAKAGRLQDRLTPKAMLRPVTKRLQGTLGEGGEKILDTFRDNPLPLTMTALGIAWLFFKDLRGGGDGAAKLEEKAGEAAQGAKEAVRKARSAVKQGFEKGSDWLSTTVQENPLALALGVLALGAIAGLTIPASSKEEEEETAGDQEPEILQKVEPVTGETPRMDIPASEEAPD